MTELGGWGAERSGARWRGSLGRVAQGMGHSGVAHSSSDSSFCTARQPSPGLAPLLRHSWSPHPDQQCPSTVLGVVELIPCPRPARKHGGGGMVQRCHRALWGAGEGLLIKAAEHHAAPSHYCADPTCCTPAWEGAWGTPGGLWRDKAQPSPPHAQSHPVPAHPKHPLSWGDGGDPHPGLPQPHCPPAHHVPSLLCA